jgi:hypothetical protein
MPASACSAGAFCLRHDPRKVRENRTGGATLLPRPAPLRLWHHRVATCPTGIGSKLNKAFTSATGDAVPAEATCWSTGCKMRDLVAFYLTVKYRAPSKERSFLAKGWGLRDVRGPYLDGFVGHIQISGAVLSSERPSTISLVLSASNRCPTSFILATALISNNEMTKSIDRNGSTDFVFESVYASSSGCLNLLVKLPEVQTDVELKRFWTILAIDELTIERLR